jgi:hypothetical protein
LLPKGFCIPRSLVGVCNVDGLMFGEALKMGLPEQDFFLV